MKSITALWEQVDDKEKVKADADAQLKDMDKKERKKYVEMYDKEKSKFSEIVKEIKVLEERKKGPVKASSDRMEETLKKTLMKDTIDAKLSKMEDEFEEEKEKRLLA